MRNLKQMSRTWAAVLTVLGLMLVASQAQTPVACGQTITNSISASSEIDQYTYTGSVGETLALCFWAPTDCGYNDAKVLDLYNPGGQLVASLTGCGPLASNLTLAATGTYTIRVHDNNYTETGDYAFGLQSFTGGGCNSAAIGCGQTTSGAISGQAEVDAYGLSVGSGTTLIFSFCGFGGAEFDLYDPAGVKLFTRTPGTAENITLTNSGAYTLLVHGASYGSVHKQLPRPRRHYHRTVATPPHCRLRDAPQIGL